MTRRKLRPDELDLWRQVARSTTRLPGASVREETTATPGAPSPGIRASAKRDWLTNFEIGQTHPDCNSSHLPPQTVSDRLAASRLNMDARAFAKMKRGKLAPEARLDLHGMTLDQAHPELTRFILTAASRNFRLVLVITGKGQREDPYSPAPLRRGVLKQQVPVWLRMPPLAGVVLQISEAHQKHGGAGAYYVYLRRNR